MPPNEYIVNLSTSGGNGAYNYKSPRLSSDDDIPLLGVHIKVTQTPGDNTQHEVLNPFSNNDEGFNFKPQPSYYVFVEVFNDNKENVKLEYFYWDENGEEKQPTKLTIMPNQSVMLEWVIIDRLYDCGYRLKINNHSKKLTFDPNVKEFEKSCNDNYEEKDCCMCLQPLKRPFNRYFEGTVDATAGQEDGVVAAKCGHRFHRECIVRFLSESEKCPFCKEEVKINALVNQNQWNYEKPLYSCFAFDIHK